MKNLSTEARQNAPGRPLFVILFGAMFLFGYIENIKGVSYPLIKAEFGISYEQQGAMVSLLSLSYVLFCLAGGILLGSFGVKKSLAAGFALLILGLAGAFFMPTFWSAAGALLCVFAGFGLFEVSLNALAARLFTSKAALLMSLLHFFYGAGSSLSPRAAGSLAAALDWRYVHLLTAPLALLFFVPALFARFPPEKNARDSRLRETKKATLLSAFRTPMVWMFSLTLGLMEVVELCSANWSGLYFQDVFHMDPKSSGAAFISNFFILFTISRLVSGFVIEKAGYVRSLFTAVCASIIIFIAGFSLGENGIRVLPALGFFSAIFWPTIFAAAFGYFKEDAPVMSSAIIVSGGAINSGIQLLIGLTNRLAGPAWGYRSCLFYALLTLAALAALARGMRRPYKTARGVPPEIRAEESAARESK